LFDPVTHENGSIAELYAPLEAMLRAINEASDDRFVSTVSPYLDLPLFIKHVTVQNFLAEWDGILGYAGVLQVRGFPAVTVHCVG
jgi:spore coat protein CotH